jgi:fatty acid desaturase
MRPSRAPPLCRPPPGVVDWQPHLRRLYTSMLAAFRVPVGTTTASPPMAVGTTGPVNTLFGHKADQARAGRAVCAGCAACAAGLALWSVLIVYASHPLALASAWLPKAAALVFTAHLNPALPLP